MAKVKLIAIAGMPGSGKGTLTDYLQDERQFPVVHFGNMVYEEVQRLGLNNVKDEKFVREDMRKQDGKEVLAKRAANKADELLKSGAPIIVLDGLYSWSEYKYLANKYGDQLLLLAVTAPRHLRYERALGRDEAHRKYTSAEQIRERDYAEIENLEKGGPIAFADYTIVNDGTPEQLLEKLDSILKNLNLFFN